MLYLGYTLPYNLYVVRERTSRKAAYNQFYKRQNWVDESSIYSTNHIRTTTGYARMLIQKDQPKKRNSRVMLFHDVQKVYTKSCFL
jgi:hypothetical protein